MQLSRLFETGEAKWSEFRLTTARGLAMLGLGRRGFCRGKAPSKTDLNVFFAVRGEKSEQESTLNFPTIAADLIVTLLLLFPSPQTPGVSPYRMKKNRVPPGTRLT